MDLGLMLLGIGCALWAGVRAAGTGPRPRGYPAAVAIAAGVVLLSPTLVRFAGQAPLAAIASALAALTVVGVLVACGVAVLRRRWVRKRVEQDSAPAGHHGHWPGVLLAGALGAGLGPHLAVVFLGALAVAVAAWRMGQEPGSRRLPLVPALVLAALAPAYWLFATIAGEEGLGLRTLSDLPLSPAAESFLAPLVLLAAWCLIGLWPLPRRTPAGLSTLVGLLLAGRVALAALPSGVEHWQPVVFPVLLIGLWQAAAAGRWAALAGGAGLLGLVSGSPEGRAGAWWLGGAAVTLEATAWLARRYPRVAPVAEGAGIMLAGWGALPVLAAAVRVEVVYTVFTVAGVALALAPAAFRQPVGPR
jgi:hypothetical protein